MKWVKQRHKLLTYGLPFLIYNVLLFTFLLNIMDYYCNSSNSQGLPELARSRRLYLKGFSNQSEVSGKLHHEHIDTKDPYHLNELQNSIGDSAAPQSVNGSNLTETKLRNYPKFANNLLGNKSQGLISPLINSYINEWHSWFYAKENFTNIATISHLTSSEVEEFRQSVGKETAIFFRIEDDIEAEISAAIEGDIFHPLPQYRNPCWKSQFLNVDEMYYGNPFYQKNVDGSCVTKIDSYRYKYKNLNKLGLQYKLRCLPSVYIAGVTKSGTSDFIHALRTLPGLLDPAVKESMYWTRVRLSHLLRANFHHYIDLFDGLGLELINSSTQSLTYDATPLYLWDFLAWPRLPGNKNMIEPKYILAHTLRALYPDTKIIILLRNPVHRLYSHYRMWYNREPAEDFHSRVEEAVRRLANCLRRFTVRACLYGRDCQKDDTLRVCRFMSASMYYLHIRDWLAVFPRHQVLVIKAEEYFEDRASIIEEVASFLGLDKLKPDTVEIIRSLRPVNSRKSRGRSLVPMMNSTYHILRKVFKPFNKRLSDLLSDEKWLWD